MEQVHASKFNDVMKKVVVEVPYFDNLIKELAGNPSAYHLYNMILEWDTYFDCKTMMDLTDLPESTFYRSMKKLRKLGLIACVGYARTNPRSKGGPRVTYWKAV